MIDIKNVCVSVAVLACILLSSGCETTQKAETDEPPSKVFRQQRGPLAGSANTATGADVTTAESASSGQEDATGSVDDKLKEVEPVNDEQENDRTLQDAEPTGLPPGLFKMKSGSQALLIENHRFYLLVNKQCLGGGVVSVTGSTITLTDQAGAAAAGH